MNALLRSLIEDPPPKLVIELTTDGVVGVLRNGDGSTMVRRAERSFAPGTLEPAPTRPNIVNAGEMAAALGGVLDDLGPRKGSATALILPDASSRLTVLDFVDDSLPSSSDERLKRIRKRLEKAVPFDIDAARISFQVSSLETGHSVLVVLTPAEIVRQYESALSQLGLWSGYVTTSTAAAMNLLADGDMTLFAKLAPSGNMTLAAIENGVVRLVRNVDLGSLNESSESPLLDEMLADIYPTQVFISDTLGQSVDRLVLCGFGDLLTPALARFPKELECSVETLKSGERSVERTDAGIWGYLSLS